MPFRSPRTKHRARIHLFLLAAALLLPATASAQKYWGLTGGATLSDLSEDYYHYEGTNSRWGGTAGLILGVRTSRSTTIALEPAWIMRGFGGTPTSYIEVPLTFGAAVRSKNGAMRYGGYTGISAAFRVSCGGDDVLWLEYPCDDLHSIDITIPIGFRLLRALSKPGTFFGVDVKYGIPIEPSFPNLDVAPRAWSFRLMYVKGIVP